MTEADFFNLSEEERDKLTALHNSQLPIRRERDRIKKEFGYLNAAYEDLKERCKHPFVRVTDRGDTGNYDPSQNRYWSEHYCPDCDKRWTVEKT
jgi:hypothetical protein